MLAFYLKKVIGMMLMPIPLTISGLIIGLLLLRRFPKSGKSLIGLSTLFLALTSWHPVANQLLQPFEDNYPPFDISQTTDVVVVLGGCHNSSDQVPAVAQLCGTSIYRLLEGLRILKHNPQAELFVSGYAGSDRRTHAEVSKEIAMSLGVDEHRIRTFPQAQDTQQEARLMLPFLKNKTFALVSEASHLPRAEVFFQQLGLTPIPAPAVVLSADNSDWRITASAQKKSERAFYEALGQAWQALKAE